VIISSEVLTYPANIQSAIFGHEFVHVSQRIRYGDAFGESAYYRNEIEAYNWILDAAGELKLPKQFLDRVKRNIERYEAKCNLTVGCRQ
jgi:hypothetical protein